MLFSEFARRMKSIIGGASSTSVFTKSLFDAILNEECLNENDESVLSEYKIETFKSYFDGKTGISKIAQKITPYIDSTVFVEYIDSFPDATRELLCKTFEDEFPNADSDNISSLLANLFVEIIGEAAGRKRKSANNQDDSDWGTWGDVAPELTPDNAGNLFFISPELTEGLLDDEEQYAFSNYIESATEYYSTKKTLLYAEKPHPFEELYVCNDLRTHRTRFSGSQISETNVVISNADIDKLEAESKYIIIEGTGGIGKSMMMTHLFLSSAQYYADGEKLPILLFLKDYKDDTINIVDFIWKSIRMYDPDVRQSSVIEVLESKKAILLMDGLDEIQSLSRNSFDRDLEAFIKSYPGNTIIITSRPTNSFISYSKFSVFDIEPLSLEQAIELVKKLEFWDKSAQENFLRALEESLYSTHWQFASNPLLLTIMLMTYSSFGEIPAKMHVFYSKAYETMSRLHDATKGSFQRPLHTKLTPEELAKYFSKFCARTYTDEVLEFSELTFTQYMKKALKGAGTNVESIPAKNFLMDLTDNLCIMYCEGGRYYFIHRSFQEYFAAVYFASDYDTKLERVGRFFEKMQHRSYTDRTFDMLYDMIPEKVERYIFLPTLQNMIAKWTGSGESADYWEFLSDQYPALYRDDGLTDNDYLNGAQSFLYDFIVRTKHLQTDVDLNTLDWPKSVMDLPTKEWVYAHKKFLELRAFDDYPNPELIPDEMLEETVLTEFDELPFSYTNYFGKPDIEGYTTEIEIYTLRKNYNKYPEICAFLEKKDFPLYTEFRNVLKYCEELEAQADKENNSDDLFED